MTTFANSFQEGNRIDHTPGAAVPAGRIVVVNISSGVNRIKGVATSDLSANELGSLDATYGRIYECTFTPGSSIVDGQDIFVQPSGELALTTNSGANPKFGQSVGAWTTAATKILVRAMFMLLFMFGVACGQAPECTDGKCLPVEANLIVADTPHVRCMVGNSCGSGTICGVDSTGAYVLSNAHVWGTQLGKVVNIDAVVDGVQRRTQGRLVFAGYSSTRMVDFAIALCPNLQSKRYMPMLKTEPAGQPFNTVGSPRCVWPQVSKPFNDSRNYGDGLITGSPDAIGGQSGSAIFNSKGQQIALLTWSINGRCAGQKTSKLWQVATTRNVMLADPRPEGLDEPKNMGDLVELQEGIFGSIAMFDVQIGTRPQCDNVIASIANQSMETMPIWADATTPPPPPPSDDCYKLTPKEWALIQFIRSQRGDADESSFDWITIIAKVLELIELIQKGRGK